jgi:hypothetical protein
LYGAVKVSNLGLGTDSIFVIFSVIQENSRVVPQNYHHGRFLSRSKIFHQAEIINCLQARGWLLHHNKLTSLQTGLTEVRRTVADIFIIINRVD